MFFLFERLGLFCYLLGTGVTYYESDICLLFGYYEAGVLLQGFLWVMIYTTGLWGYMNGMGHVYNKQTYLERSF